MKTPKVSVLMAVRDGAAHLEASLASILGQSLEALELLVVDDGSRDSTPDILDREARSDARLRVFRNPAPSGLPAALNLAAKEALAPVFARQDADDISLPERLQAQLAALQDDPGLALVGTRYSLLDIEGELAARQGPVSNSLAEALTPGPCLFAHGTAMFRADCFHALGGYDTRFFYSQDLDLWCRFASAGYGVARVERPLYLWRVGPARPDSPKTVRQRQLTNLLRRRHVEGETIDLELEALALQPVPTSPAAAEDLCGYWTAMALHAAQDRRLSRGLACLAKCLGVGCIPSFLAIRGFALRLALGTSNPRGGELRRLA